MKFSADAWRRNSALYNAIQTMPFNRELASGALSQERFRRYIIQDAHYLGVYGRCLAIAAGKASTPDQLVQLAGSAQRTVMVERSLHEGFLKTYGVTPAEFAAAEMSPSCHAYTSFLLASAHHEPFPIAVAALLPCAWIYEEVGREIQARAAPANPYQAWIDAYTSDDFRKGVKAAIALVDQAATEQTEATVEAMHSAFTTSARFEWMFWDSAYRLEQWPA
ncbi:MAG: thiaminase II [Rhizobiales bacterium 65-9]|nr:thiaminase II [Hyphomicrobiales bacterium]OJY33817.1 MAG: thiaminase II [Rhizobiales bacterium 65-9]